MKIPKPTIGRIVLFTAWRGEGEASGKVDEYAGVVVKVHKAEPSVQNGRGGIDAGVLDGTIDIVTLGSQSVYHNNNIVHDANGKAGTWRYPPHSKEEIEVDA